MERAFQKTTKPRRKHRYSTTSEVNKTTMNSKRLYDIEIEKRGLDEGTKAGIRMRIRGGFPTYGMGSKASQEPVFLDSLPTSVDVPTFYTILIIKK